MHEILDRYAAGETQTRLAERFGTSQTVISNLITGKSKPPLNIGKIVAHENYRKLDPREGGLLNFFSVNV
ncbi:MAG TPA: helix-turn-helix transcriptional regulator, partial [Candidatus Bathyarchaeia archaeon]|nr:helix-turn-helix transcriptional regulator [Candidatus Bathyarchaeia archaeon]